MKSKKLMIVYIVMLIIVVAIMVINKNHKPVAIQDRDYPEIRKEGILHLETEYSQAGYYVSEDTIQGFHYELGQAIAKVSGLEVQNNLEMNLSKSFQHLNNNQCDIIARNIPITSELKENYLFTDPIVLNKQVLVQRKDSTGTILRNQLELAQKKLYVPEDSPALLRLKNLQQEIGDTIYIQENETYSSEQLIMMVANGDIDYAVCDHQIAETLKNQFPNIDTETDISFTQLQAWVIRKNSPALLDSLNSWIRQIKESGTFDKIYKSYYKQ